MPKKKKFAFYRFHCSSARKLLIFLFRKICFLWSRNGCWSHRKGRRVGELNSVGNETPKAFKNSSVKKQFASERVRKRGKRTHIINLNLLSNLNVWARLEVYTNITWILSPRKLFEHTFLFSSYEEDFVSRHFLASSPSPTLSSSFDGRSPLNERFRREDETRNVEKQNNRRASAEVEKYFFSDDFDLFSSREKENKKEKRK